MSPIEQLKAEAHGLRETERAAGRDLKHSEALERIARKHGYANWRACVARIGTAEEAAPAAPPAPAALAASPLRSEAEGIRNLTMTRWLSPALAQAAVDFSKNLGLLPLYSETSDKGVRYLFWNLPDGALCEVRSGRTQDQFRDLDEKNRAKGRRLIALHIGEDQRHSAVWISENAYGAAVRHLEEFGIGPAAAGQAA